jgi:3-hydroxybutyryl-CoA dehydrogenase
MKAANMPGTVVGVIGAGAGLAEDLGAANTLRIMERPQGITGEDRYRPSLWMKRRAALGLPIHTLS